MPLKQLKIYLEKKSISNDSKNLMKILVTGSAGFVGFHLILKLLKLKNQVIGIDNINSYYSKITKNIELKF